MNVVGLLIAALRKERPSRLREQGVYEGGCGPLFRWKIFDF